MLATMGVVKLVAAAIAVMAVVAGVVVVVIQVSKPTRSVEAFCSTMNSEQERILAEFDANNGDGHIDDFSEAMAGMLASVQALGELQVYFQKLAEVAPPEIQTETQLVADKIGDQMKIPDFSITGVGNQLIAAIMLSGPMDAVNRFALKNCGKSV